MLQLWDTQVRSSDVFHTQTPKCNFNSEIFSYFQSLDCHLSNSERTAKQISIELINPKAVHGINALAVSCIEPYDTLFCLNGGRCFNITVVSYTFPSCECATGFIGERCERKYLNRSYNRENYMQTEDIIQSQYRSNIGEHKNLCCCCCFFDNIVVSICSTFLLVSQLWSDYQISSVVQFFFFFSNQLLQIELTI